MHTDVKCQCRLLNQLQAVLQLPKSVAPQNMCGVSSETTVRLRWNKVEFPKEHPEPFCSRWKFFQNLFDGIAQMTHHNIGNGL